MKEVHEGGLARVTLPRDEYDDGQFLLWLEVELLQVVVAQHLLFPEDVLHEPVDVGKLARLRLEPHRMIEVPESAVHHLLGIDIVGKDDEVVVAGCLLGKFPSVVRLDGAVLPLDEQLGDGSVGHRLFHNLVVVGAHTDVAVGTAAFRVSSTRGVLTVLKFLTHDATSFPCFLAFAASSSAMSASTTILRPTCVMASSMTPLRLMRLAVGMLQPKVSAMPLMP